MITTFGIACIVSATALGMNGQWAPGLALVGCVSVLVGQLVEKEGFDDG